MESPKNQVKKSPKQKQHENSMTSPKNKIKKNTKNQNQEKPKKATWKVQQNKSRKIQKTKSV